MPDLYLVFLSKSMGNISHQSHYDGWMGSICRKVVVFLYFCRRNGESTPSEPRLAAICRNVPNDEPFHPSAPRDYELRRHSVHEVAPVAATVNYSWTLLCRCFLLSILLLYLETWNLYHTRSDIRVWFVFCTSKRSHIHPTTIQDTVGTKDQPCFQMYDD